jgi:carboxymethylenebutenolidase
MVDNSWRADRARASRRDIGGCKVVKPDNEIQTSTQITAADGHVFDAYMAVPSQTPRGALVVIQDAFGIGPYIRSVCDAYCADGYLTITPALYDRQQRGAVFDHSPESHKAAARCRAALNWEHVVADVEAAIARVCAAGPVGILGFCVGGSVAWLTAASLPVAAAACYYGKDIVDWRDRTPRCPTILHFGDADHLISLSDVDAIKRAYPDLPTYVYPAGHGFDGVGKGHHAGSAALARSRTLEFFRKHVG